MPSADNDAMTETPSSVATDADIAAIVRENEPGIADIMEAYEVIERAYFAATSATPDELPGAYATNTASG